MIQGRSNCQRRLTILSPNRNYLITHTARIPSVCPKTGQPDFGVINVSIFCGEKCVELKSLKYYLQVYRNEGIFCENVINRILDDLVAVTKPKWMEVREISRKRGIALLLFRLTESIRTKYQTLISSAVTYGHAAKWFSAFNQRGNCICTPGFAIG
ncbi:MAG: preQ(1) synthase [Ignavibacteria bacterium]|nr:preQ(1) synthase [Ignavibacteria bacterium]